MPNSDKGDYILSLAAVAQSFLVILQQCLISILHIEEESTTIYRVILSALPILCAFIYILKRNLIKTVVVYAIAILILLLHVLFFPKNAEYLVYSSTRFLLPIVIPTALAIISVRRFEIFEKTFLWVSWLTFGLVLLYIGVFISGVFTIDSYNMSFSYGLLFPSLILYNQKNVYSKLAALFLVLVILAIGSRGALVVFIVYILYDIVVNKIKYLSLLILLIGISSIFIVILSGYFESIGISSRTLSLLIDGSIDHESGRSYIYDRMLSVFWQSHITGIGLYGDRVFLDGSYCHNILLELYLNWGLFVASFIIVYFIYKITNVYFSLNSEWRNKLVIFMLASILPLFVSASYLESYNIALFLGVLFSLKKQYKNINKITIK